MTDHQFPIATLPVEDRVIAEQLIREMSGIANKVAKMGRLICSMSDKGQEEFIGAFPASDQALWRRVQKVGRGEMAPALATKQGVAARFLAKLPVEEQARYIRELIPVAITDGRGRQDTILMDVDDMSTAIRRQVFRAHGTAAEVRDIPAQRAYLAEQDRKSRVAEEKVERAHRIERSEWTVEDGKIFPNPILIEKGITRLKLAKMLADLRR